MGKKQTDKNLALIEKCNDLAEKIENEKNPIKRTFYSIKIKMVLAKIDRQIGREDLKEKYAQEREDRVESAKESKLNTRSEIIQLNKEISKLRKFLKNNKDFDYGSTDFIFPKEEVEQEGGIESYIDNLRTSEREDQVEVATEVENALAKRRELEEKEKLLNSKKEELKASNKKVKSENNKSKAKETSLIVLDKINIFQKVGSFFKSVFSGIGDTVKQAKDIKELKGVAKEEKQDRKEELQNEWNEIQDEYEAEMKQLKEEYEQKKQTYKTANKEELKFIKDTNKTVVKDYKQEQRTQQARGFKAELAQQAEGFRGELPEEITEETQEPEEIEVLKGEVIDNKER